MDFPDRLVKHRNRQGETIGGGFVIFRRGRTSGRIHSPRFETPFEHKDFAAAEAEAKRLSLKEKGVEYCVFYQVTSAKK